MSHPARNRGLVIGILGSLATLSPFAIDMYLPAFPDVAAELHVSTATVSLSISSYFAGLAAGQFVYGPMLDRFGRKRPLYFGLILFAVASLLCAGARTSEWLVAMRFLQALGGCAAQVGCMAMVRDFFPVRETAKIISLIILILGASPLLAPTVGGFISVHLGWRWVFIVLAIVALLNLAVVYWYLPQGHQPDKSVSLHPVPIIKNFIAVLREPQFLTFALSGAFSFSGLLVYVAGSPIIFMEVFHVSANTFGAIFAGLAVGFIGSNQTNVMLLKKFSSEQIFKATFVVVCPLALLFLAGAHLHWFGLVPTLLILFVVLSSLGLACPNSAALALVPFETNIGSASAMLGVLQIGVSGLASASIGIFDSHSMLPVTVVLAATTWIGLAIYVVGRRWIPQLKFVEEKGAETLKRDG